MTIALPTAPLPQSVTVSPVLFGGPILAGLGGEDQYINRLGSRWQLDVQTPRLVPEPDGRLWTDVLAQAWVTGERVSFAVPQPGLAIGDPGTPVINGSGQTGSGISLRGFAGSYLIRRGQFFSIMSGGRRYLHRVAHPVDIGATAAGDSIFGILPMLRVSPADGDTVEFLNPAVEGIVLGDQRSWTHVIARTQGLKFSIRETR